MKKLILLIIGLALTLVSLSQNLPEYAPGQLIVRVKGNLYQKCKTFTQDYKSNQNLIESDTLFSKLGIYKVENLHYQEKDKNRFLKSGSERSFVIYTKQSDIQPLLDELRKIHDVEYAYPNYLFFSHITPDDKKYDKQWSLPKINMPDAWDLQKGCVDIKIAILDAGFRDLEHNDVDDKFLSTQRDETDIVTSTYTNIGYKTVSGEDYTTPDNNPEGKSFHGLQVSGVAAAETNNNKGIAGVGWDINIVPVRAGFTIKHPILGKVGLFETDDIIRAIDWIVAGNRARVINMSLGGPFPTGTVLIDYENSLEAANNAGIVVVVSSGNDNDSQISYPASSQFTIAIGATNDSDNRASFSNYGSNLDIVAPGVDILTVNRKVVNKYKKVDGTSFSAPIVSGVVALILSQNPELTPERVREILQESADKVSGMGGQNFHNQYGFGRVDAKRALEFVPEIEYDIVLNNKVINNLQIVFAQNSITASNYVIQPGANVEFKAGNVIELLPGFEADAGSNFHAYIDNVGKSCSTKSLKKTSVQTNDSTTKIITSKKVVTIQNTPFDSSFIDKKNKQIQISKINNSNLKLFVSPNPFSNNATVEFEIKETPKSVKIYITDLMGRKIKTLVESANNPKGKYDISFSIEEFKSGIYYILLETESKNISVKVVQLK